MAVHIQKKPTTTATAQGGQNGTVTPPPKEDKKEHLQQSSTGSADVWNAPEDAFLIGNGVTFPEKMSDQAKELCRTDPGYLTQYVDMQNRLHAGATANSFKTSALPHLKPLAEWFNKRKDRARDTAQWGEPSPEFMVWPGICSHLGPNPDPGKLSIDRIDPTKPYVAGNLRWADRATQAANQRRNRKNAWNDIAITDAQLADELAKLGVLNHQGQPHTRASIKQMRYRIKEAKDKDKKPRFPTPEAIHAELLKRLKVPAITQKSGDPIQDEPLMEGLGIDWEKVKQSKPWLPNIVFQIQHTAHLEEELQTELAYLRKTNPKYGQGQIDQLEARLTAVLDFQRRLKNRLQQLHDKKANKLIAEINPHATGKHPVPEGFHHKPALLVPVAVPAPPPTPPEPEPVITIAGDDETTATLWWLDGKYPTYEDALEAYHAGAHKG